MKFLLFLVGLVSISQASIEFKPWDKRSNPAIMSKTFEKKFSALPLDGQVKDLKKFWSSDYWPLFKGGINYRWHAQSPVGFNLNSPTFKQAKKMSQVELESLAPSEKFDLYTGNYSYPLRKEVQKRASPRRREWEGICHGWAAAALNHNEPQPKVVTNPQGIKIPFGSSDIKALLSYFYAYHHRPVSTYQMGRRCVGLPLGCTDDMNAGAFHIVLANKVGLKGQGFIADIENGKEVWNQVVFNYQSQIKQLDLPPSIDSAEGTISVIRIITKVRVVFNIVSNSWLPANGTNLQTFRDNDYEYDLDIDSKGRIIGGNWISQARPDFLWLMKATTNFGSRLSKLKKLL
jgi:hypothetical protein